MVAAPYVWGFSRFASKGHGMSSLALLRSCFVRSSCFRSAALRTLSPLLLSAIASVAPSTAHADAPAAAPGPAIAAPAAERPARGGGLELNVLWPFFPGGITELRLLVPVLRPRDDDFRGELVVGTYADFASRVVRDEGDGKVRTLAAKLGYRQFFVHGTHLEVSANLGWRNEVQRPDGASYDAFHARVWLLGGYQHDFSPRFYGNARAALGVHLYRSDRFAAEEKKIVPGADLNLGVRF